MIYSLNHTLAIQVLTADLISASASGPAHSTGYVVNLASRHKTRPAQWGRHIQVSLYSIEEKI